MTGEFLMVDDLFSPPFSAQWIFLGFGFWFRATQVDSFGTHGTIVFNNWC